MEQTDTTTTTTPKVTKTTSGQHSEDCLVHYDMAPYANPHQQLLASPTRAAQQAAALDLVAAQQDIARRDGVINTMRNRWWQKLYCDAIHQNDMQSQLRQIRALRQAYVKAQQLQVHELQLEEIEMIKTIERLQVQLRDCHREQAERADQKTEKHSAAEQHTAAIHVLSAQLTESERQCKQWQQKAHELELQASGSQQHQCDNSAVHLLSIQLAEYERQWKHWQHNSNDLECQLKALQQQYDKDVDYTAELQEDYGKLIEKYDSLSAQRDSDLQHGIEMQEQIGNLHKELQRLEQGGAHVYWWRL